MGLLLSLSLAILAVATAAAAHSVPDLSDVDVVVNDAIASGEIPGAVVLVGQRDRVLYHQAFGLRALVPTPLPMTPDTIFDIASLTKPLGTALAVMSLVERGAVKLDAPLGRYLKEFRGRDYSGVTIQRLLTHSAGLPAIPPDAAVARGFPAAAAALAKVKLDYPPGTGFQYSDTGFILLAEVVRRAGGEPLDRYLARTLYRPLALRDTTFHPDGASHNRIAPTQFHNGHLLQGQVHDPRARLLGGVAGHAGIFSTASDLARICRMLLADGSLDGRRLFRPATVKTMWTRTADGNGTRALGWDVASRYAAPMAPFFPAGSVGHTGFTGTSVWIDPATRSYVILLTNRVHPSGGGATRVRELRTRVTAAVGAALFGGEPPRSAAMPPDSGLEAPDARTVEGAPPVESPAPGALEVAAGVDSDAGASAGWERPRGAPGNRSATPRTGLSTSARSAVALAPAGGDHARGEARAGTAIKTGLDMLASQKFATLSGYSVGLVTNQTGLDAAGRRAIDLLAAAPGVRLKAIFSPEHGITGAANADVPHGRDAATGRPIWSLYGPTRRPTAAMLKDVNLIVFDIQDVGARYYTYLTTLVYIMEEAARAKIPVLVLDRPNPITGRVVEGPLMDPDLQSFTAPHAIPVRTGLTIGEFARMAAAEKRIPVSLTVMRLEGWVRSRWYDETGLPWVNPSPNIRSVTQALLYSGVGLLEATNLSVGRGTDTPFEVVGAPWIEPAGLAGALNQRGLRGVRFEPVWFVPASDVFARQTCGGVRLVVTDRDAIRPVTVGLALARELRARHRDPFRPEAIQNLLVNRSTMWAFLRGEPLDRVLAWAEAERATFLSRRAPYLIYR